MDLPGRLAQGSFVRAADIGETHECHFTNNRASDGRRQRLRQLVLWTYPAFIYGCWNLRYGCSILHVDVRVTHMR
jgi:hypothetical protein